MINLLFFALIFLMIPLCCYLLFGWAILYHINRYGFRQHINRELSFVFVIVMLALSLFLIKNFFAVDWNRASAADFLKKSNLNSLIEFYD